MNFLAHALLSGKDEDLLFGNFIADSVKGNQLNQYSPEVQRGIHLHRTIDQFTDLHPEVKKAVLLLNEYFRKYAPVVLDIYFDHFLAKDWNTYHEGELKTFSWQVYKAMLKRFDQLPARSKRILPWMIAQDWLTGYRDYHALDRVFKGMARRTRFPSGMEQAVGYLKEHQEQLQLHFDAFFPQLEKYCQQWINENPLHESLNMKDD